MAVAAWFLPTEPVPLRPGRQGRQGQRLVLFTTACWQKNLVSTW